MKKTFSCLLAGILCVLCSCAAPQKKSDVQSGDFTFNVTLKNNTRFDVEIVDDSRIVPGQGEKRITLPVFFGELNDGYHINYRVRLLDEVFIKIPRNENILIKPDQNNVIIETADFQSDLCFLILQNDEKQTVSLKMDNAYLSALVQGEPKQYGPTPYLGPGKSYVYEIKAGPNDIVLERDQYRALPLPFSRALPGHIYTFLFKGNEVALTDARPLHRVGESGWVRPVPVTEAKASTALLVNDGTIRLFAPVNNGVIRYDYDSGGNKKAEVGNGDGFQVLSAARAGDGYFMAGYEKTGDRFLPIAKIHNADGTMRRLLEPSNRPEFHSAFYKTAAHNAAQKDGAWLVAGGAKAIGDNDSFAYARLVTDNGTALAANWEIGEKEFNDVLKITKQTPVSVARCGEIRCVMYDAGRNRWLVSGENLEYDSGFSPVTGSYLAVIGNDGKIQKIDTSYKGMSFYKILLDKEGNYYLIGEEEKGKDTFAVIIKYNSDGKKTMQNSVSPPSHSWYQDAVLDIENGQIILGGTMQAADEYGYKGVPFIEALSLEKFERLWQSPLKDLGEVSLVTALVPAPDYGFALALSGINNDGYIDQPYLIARVNARGKIIK